MQPIRWLWGCADHKSHVRIITAMVISAVTSLMLLVNPSLTATLVDEVIIAENPEPLLGILAVMLVVKLGSGRCMRYADDRHCWKQRRRSTVSSSAARTLFATAAVSRTPVSSTATAPAI